MRKILFILTIMLFLPCIVHATPQDILAEIKKSYADIEKKRPEFQKKTLAGVLGYSLEGANIAYHFDKQNKIAIIDAVYLGETFRLERAYYFKNNQLLFIYHVMYRYRMDERGLTGVNIKESKILKERLYFHNNKLVRWLDADGKSISAQNLKYREIEKEILEHVRLLQKDAPKL